MFALYLRGERRRVSSPSLLPAWMRRHVPASLCFYCVRQCTYLQLALLMCTRYSYLTKCTAFLKRRVDSSLPACARMCVALICRTHADLSRKADLACVLPTDTLVIITRSHCNSKGRTSTRTQRETLNPTGSQSSWTGGGHFLPMGGQRGITETGANSHISQAANHAKFRASSCIS